MLFEVCLSKQPSKVRIIIENHCSPYKVIIRPYIFVFVLITLQLQRSKHAWHLFCYHIRKNIVSPLLNVFLSCIIYKENFYHVYMSVSLQVSTWFRLFYLDVSIATNKWLQISLTVFMTGFTLCVSDMKYVSKNILNNWNLILVTFSNIIVIQRLVRYL